MRLASKGIAFGSIMPARRCTVSSVILPAGSMTQTARGLVIAFKRTRGRRKPILESSAVNVGDPIEVRLKKGGLQCTVDARTLGIVSVWPSHGDDDITR